MFNTKIISQDIRTHIHRWRRTAFEAIGNDRYSRPSLNDIDKKLEKYLDFERGFFVEAGGNDGYHQSNTYYLEKFKNWRGILIEGIPELAKKCAKTRPASSVVNCALVGTDFNQPTIKMSFANLMSIATGAFADPEQAKTHVRTGLEVQGITKSYEIEVQARTLTSVLDGKSVPAIDFFSLDVEGFELQVLSGLDFCKYRPRWICVEARDADEVTKLLTRFEYMQIEQLSHHDYLFGQQNK